MKKTIVGIERVDEFKHVFEGKRVGLITNPTGIDSSFVSSIDILASETGLTSDEVRTAIKHLISTGELTKQSTNKYTLFSVVNYDLYQPVSQAEPKQAPSYSQSIPNNRRNKEYKEINNICAPEPHDTKSDNESQLQKDFEIIYTLYPKKRGSKRRMKC